MSRKTFIFSSVLLVVLLAGGFVVYKYVNKPHRSVHKADFIIEADQLLAEFEQDEAKANSKYLDKVIEVKGTVKDVIERERVLTLLLGNKAALGSVSCALHPSDSESAYGIKPGETVTVRGICTGMLLDVALSNCKVVE